MTELRGKPVFQRLPRRLRRGRVRLGFVLPKLLFLLLGALVLRLFFTLLGQSSFLWERIDTDFFESVLSSELWSSRSTEVLNPNTICLAQSAVLTSLPAYEFRMAADDEFDGEFSPFGIETWGELKNTDAEDASSGEVSETTALGDSVDSISSGDESLQSSDSDSNTENSSSVENDPNVRSVTIIPSSPAGYDYGEGVYIKNETDYSIDVGSYLNRKPKLDLTSDDPVILIIHTHASEAYYPDGEDIYVPTDTERTDDKNYNVVRVGDEITELIEEHGYGVIHIRDIFDYPSYSGSYTRTLKVIESVLEENPTIQIVIDIHRDAMVSASGSTYRTITEIEEEMAAQILLVVGTDEGGLKHPNWRENLTLAVHLQKRLTEDYPLLARPINLRSERFNQHATFGSFILEVGTSSNTLKEALYSARLFASSFCNLLDAIASEQ